jgi:aspartate-semialdehyde dehydrogenase
VGQKFIHLLQNHPWFEIKALGASEKRVGQNYGDAVRWHQPSELPARVAEMKLQSCDLKEAADHWEVPLVFSALDAGVANALEPAFAQKGVFVVSNTRSFRMDRNTPLLIPEVNAEQLQLISNQQIERDWPGAIITNPNCSTIFLSMALAPLHKAFGLEKVQVMTMQAISGAGYPGVPSQDILGNVIPYISGEEEKIQTETKKILGSFQNQSWQDGVFDLAAQANRVPVQDGHTECVSVQLKEKADFEQVRNCFLSFKSDVRLEHLPSAPPRAIEFLEGSEIPQPKWFASRNRGMSTFVGRLRECPVLDYRFIAMGHNTVRGAAGAAVLNAELLLDQGWIGAK